MSNSKHQYDRNGFVVVRQFLPADELGELRANLDRYIRDVVPTLPDGDAFYQDGTRPETLKQLQHMGRDVYFSQYRERPQWRDLACELIGEEASAADPEWFNKPPGAEHPTPPHQDNFYFCLRPANVLTMWLALDPVDAENGCLRYVRGSHRKGLRLHARTGVLGFSQGIVDYGPADTADEVEIHLAPGDLVVHHGETIHRADPNRTASRHRRAFAMVYRGVSCRRDEHAFANYQTALQSQHMQMGLATS